VSAPESIGEREIWSSLEELTGTPEFQNMLHREFPEDATAWNDPVSRRTFLTIAGASAALAGAGCWSPRPASREKIYPYVRQPEQMTLGLPLFFATGFTLNGITVGVLGKSREGRPIKLEGNPTHPGSLGGIDSITQASLIDLYDPDRSRSIVKNGGATPTTWETALTELRTTMDRLKGEGKAVRILTETIGSPTLGSLIDEVVKTYPNTKWVQYEPANRDNSRQGGFLAFGRYVNTIYDFSKALRVVSLDSDFLVSGPTCARYSRDFNRLRNTHLREGEKVPKADELNRLYVIESMLTATGGVADHRLPMRSSDIESFARALARELGVAAGDAQPPTGALKWVSAIAKDLQAFKGKSVVIVGEHQPPAVHAIAHAINATLGNNGTTVIHTEPVEVKPTNQTEEFKALVGEMNTGTVAAMFILGVNPVYTSPADLDFAGALKKVPIKVHLGQHIDETAVACDWHINEAHYLETWGDGRAYDGTASVCQPLIAPLHGGRSAIELMAALLPEAAELHPREIIKNYWRKNWPQNGGSTGGFDSGWQVALRDGVIANSARPRIEVNAGNIPAYKAPAAGMEVNIRPDPTIFDGRFINNSWLQELPKPITKLTWDNAIIVSPATAKAKGLEYRMESTGGGEHGRAVAQMAELTVNGKTVKGAVWVQYGHADDSITVHLGYGRRKTGKVGAGTGFDAYPLRTTTAASTATGADIKGTGEEYILACTQAHFSMQGRRPVRQATRDEYEQNWVAHQKDPDYPLFAKVPKVAAPEWQSIDQTLPGNEHGSHGHHHHHDEKSEGEKHEEHKGDPRLKPLTLYPETNKDDKVARWAMAIDLSKCTGCSACLSACVAENNIPMVGKKEVTRGREMHWIRIDRYYEGDPASGPENIATHFQPVPCQQCEKAPCEVVCPVAATVHSFDGLNDMVYNRCVGTRYCSNNCPYKVRRFNFLTFADWKTDTYKLMRNPEVTVRERGVMEKCTYCVQRIRSAEIEAERVGRRVKDGEILTACQQACPAEAIVFGDLSDAKSRVNQWKQQPTNYGLLAELNTMPRTSYLAAVRNPNPELAKT
jgi:molybdopterin-containing oxidoreductase family iron-sulfur binding subunit